MGICSLRWDVALHFGNFLKGENVSGTGSQAYANLSKYVHWRAQARVVDSVDCTSRGTNFDQWQTAFLRGLKCIAVTWLYRYVFPINLFEDASARKSALIIENRKIMLYATPDVSFLADTIPARKCAHTPEVLTCTQAFTF